jgi:hypothetical protein
MGLKSAVMVVGGCRTGLEEGADECGVGSSGGEGCSEEDGGVASGRVVNRMPVDTAETC